MALFTTTNFDDTNLNESFSFNPPYGSLIVLNRDYKNWGKVKEALVDTDLRKAINEANRRGEMHPLNAQIDAAFIPIGQKYVSTRTDDFDIWNGRSSGIVKIPYYLSTSLEKDFVKPEHRKLPKEKIFRTILLGNESDRVIIPNNAVESEVVHPRDQEYEIIRKDGNIYYVRYRP